MFVGKSYGPWADENRVEMLKKLWSEGMSCSQIADRIGGISRNSVIGKVHRLGLSGRTTTNRKKTKHRATASPSATCETKRISTKSRPNFQIGTEFKARHFPVDASPLPLPQEIDIPRVAFADTHDGHCKWIIGDDMPRMCCGDARIPGLAYCQGHAQRAFATPVTRKRAQMKDLVDAEA